MHTSVLLLFAAWLPAQAPVPSPAAPQELPADLLALAGRVEAAHRPGGPVPKVTALKAAMEQIGRASCRERV